MSLRASRGFTLVEALAAFAIVAVVLSQIYPAISGAVRGDMAAAFEQSAVRIARSQFGRLGVELFPAQPPILGQEVDGITWSMRFAAYDGQTSPGWTASWAILTVRNSSRSTTFKTLAVSSPEGRYR